MQIEKRFLPEVGKKPIWARWKATDSLFFTWVGINDCAFGPNIDEKMTAIFVGQEQLYKAGARNFLFVNLPPIDRSPGAMKAERRAKMLGKPSILQDNNEPRDRRQIFHEWNDKLIQSARAFCDSHPEDITVMIYSSYDTFTRVLDDPASHGFSLDDIDKEGGAIWNDNLHPTTAMHDLVAKDMASFLGDQPAFVGKQSWWCSGPLNRAFCR
jgi:phospholipase/lecithinase/hemolysin